MKIKTIKAYEKLEEFENKVNAASEELKAKFTQTHIFSHNKGICYTAVLFYE